MNVNTSELAAKTHQTKSPGSYFYFGRGHAPRPSLEGHALHPVCFTCVSLLSQEKFPPPPSKKSCMKPCQECSVCRIWGLVEGNQIDKLVLLVSQAYLQVCTLLISTPSVPDTGKLAAQLWLEQLDKTLWAGWKSSNTISVSIFECFMG